MNREEFKHPEMTIQVWIIIMCVCPANILALWWAVGGHLVVDRNTICRRTKRYGGRLQEICQREPEIIEEIMSGMRLATDECQYQFRDRLWNCTDDKRAVAKLLKQDTREAAYLEAIAGAGSLHGIADSCSKGRLLQCSCDSSFTNQQPIKPSPITSGSSGGTPVADANWIWGGCTDDVAFAYRTAKDFVEASTQKAKGIDFRTLQHSHNYEAGRLASTKNMKQVCKCHGLSASCAMKTCWRKLPPFNQVAERLKFDRYDRAILVTMPNNHEVTLQPVIPNNKIEEEDLVYSQASPNYCKKNKKKGSLGTVGRTCDPRSVRLDSCNTLCCGRRYEIYNVTLIENCRCKFKWCCEVVCETCERVEKEYRCS